MFHSLKSAMGPLMARTISSAKLLSNEDHLNGLNYLDELDWYLHLYLSFLFLVIILYLFIYSFQHRQCYLSGNKIYINWTTS